MFVADLKLSDESQARLIAHHISLNLALNAKVGRKKIQVIWLAARKGILTVGEGSVQLDLLVLKSSGQLPIILKTYNFF